jgi:hypothetical protein
MIEDAKLTKSDTPAPEVGSSALFGWLGEEIARNRRRAEQATALADRLASLMAGACAAGQWRGVKTVKLVTDRAYVIRRPGTTSLELATWHDGWRTIMGHIANGGELEVWEPNAEVRHGAKDADLD